MGRPPELFYSVNEMPPPLVVIVSALQHVAVISNTIVFPLILAREAGLATGQFLDFVSVSMLTLGIATILLCMQSRYLGSGYLCPAGFTQIYVGPSLFALHHGGLGFVFGMTAIAGLAQIAIAPVLRRLRAILPPEIAGLVIAIVGLSIATLAHAIFFGTASTADHGIQPVNLAIAGTSLTTMVVLNIWTKGYTKMFCVLWGVLVGYGASAAFGELDFSAAAPKEGLALLRMPGFQHITWQFDVQLLAPFLVGSIATTLAVVGAVSNAQRLNDLDWVRPNFRSLAGGVAGTGLASMISGMMGSSGFQSNSASIGLSGATGVTSRGVGHVIGLAFVLLSFVPAIAVVVAAMPIPVIGASLFFSSAFVLTTGMQMITTRLLDSRKIIVIGFSFAMAVMADIYKDEFAAVPVALQPVFGNSLVLGTVCAVLLNLILRIGVRQRVSFQLQQGQTKREAVEEFLAGHGARWAARRDIVNRAIFGVAQLLVMLGDPPGGVEIEARFDEFNLDLRIRYAGAPIVIPDQKPSPREILDSEHGEQLLAGYLLRRSADRINCRKLGDRAEVHLHYDH